MRAHQPERFKSWSRRIRSMKLGIAAAKEITFDSMLMDGILSIVAIVPTTKVSPTTTAQI